MSFLEDIDSSSPWRMQSRRFNNLSYPFFPQAACLDKCVQKFTRVNQRIMNVYVEVQTGINERRVAEMEAQAQSQTLASTEQQQAIPTANQSDSFADSNTMPQIEVKAPQEADNAVR